MSEREGAVMVSPEQVGERYLAVHHRMRRAAADSMSGCGVSMARTKVLMQLRHRGPVRQSVLAADLGVAAHSVTDIVDALERDGLVERRSDPTDRRAKLVALTGAGEAAVTVACTARERLMTSVFGALTAEDRATMLRLLGVLDTAVAALTGCPPESAAEPGGRVPESDTEPVVLA
ncbi:MAG: MarR family winged helix-turn-helix transcriptional regulator [Streptosporangiaceae bacterium]